MDDDVAAQALDAWSRRLGTFYSSILSPSSRSYRDSSGYPFKSASVFLPDELGGEGEGEVPEVLRRCIEKFRLATGDDAFDWDTDKYFLDGLEHLRNCRIVQWELEDDNLYQW